MRSVVRVVAATVLAVGCVVAVSASWAMATALPLLAAHTTALIMGGTSHPLIGPKDEPGFVTSYLDNAVLSHLDPAFIGPVTNAVGVFTPEEFFPIGKLTLDESVAAGLTNLHRCLAAGADCVFNDDPAVMPAVGPSSAPQVGDAMMVFGFSQSSMIASLAKQDLIRDQEADTPVVPFALVANPMRPNGGILMRGQGLPSIPVLGISFLGPSPTNSAMVADGVYVYPTVDIARQYDALGGDFPVRPRNLLALVNSLFGYRLLHGETVVVPFTQARYQGREGDTSYYLIETDIVPVLQPFASLVPAPILKAMDAPLRVIIEDAYDREVSPGTPTPLSWRRTEDVFALADNLIRSLPVAVDNLFEGYGYPRLLGSEAPGAYGVGGPELPDEPETGALAQVAPRQQAPAAESEDTDPVDPAAPSFDSPGVLEAHGEPLDVIDPDIPEAPDVEETPEVAELPDIAEVVELSQDPDIAGEEPALTPTIGDSTTPGNRVDEVDSPDFARAEPERRLSAPRDADNSQSSAVEGASGRGADADAA